jgi:hypothetical protein
VIFYFKSPLASVEATGVCIPIGISEIRLATLYKSPGRTCSDADNSKLLSFIPKSILESDLNDKHPFGNSAVSNFSGDLSELEISAPQCPTHNSPAGNGDVLDIVVL